MATIKTQVKSASNTGWVFAVEVEGMSYEVKLEKQDYERLSNGKSPEELVEKSFEFLLERESKESILRQFNLMEIARYFSEYESEISK